MSSLIEHAQLLTMFDLVGSEDVAQEALFSVFVTRPDLLDAVEFNGTLLCGGKVDSDTNSSENQMISGPRWLQRRRSWLGFLSTFVSTRR